MKFNPLTDKELAEQRGTIAAGKGDFEVLEAEERLSKSSGNPMLALKLKVWDQNGREGRIFDYIVANAQWKLKACLESIGLGADYDKGEINPMHIEGKSGRLLIEVKKDPDYGDKPVVKTYLPLQETLEIKDQAKAINATEPPDFSDDIPF